MENSFRKLVSCVILDLDGTLLNTDCIVSDVLRVYLVKHGKQWDERRAHRIVGKTPYEAAAAVVEDYELSISADELLSETSPVFSDQWCNIKAQPGANRLIKYLSSKGVPLVLASNSPKANIETKISHHQGWKESFSFIIGGDEVSLGKPSPEIYIEAAKRLKMDPSSCLVIEDSLPGVIAGKEAGMEVVAVPSLPKQSQLFSSADEVINSLLDFQPEKWGLPAFEDWVEGTLPIEPWYIGGPVIKGFGRGSEVLGIPTEIEPHELWYDDDDSSCVEKLKTPSDMDREWQRRHDQFHTIGYRDGLIAGKEASVQEGFNIGFKDSVSIGYNWGLARGITSAMTFLPHGLKEKMVETEEMRNKFQCLYESIHSLSSTDALKLFHECHKRKPGNQYEDATRSASDADLNNQIRDIDVLHNYYRELRSLMDESPLVDVRILNESIEKSLFTH